MVDKLHIDIETYSSIDIMKAGAYKYCESLDFEILMVAYAFNDDPIVIIDLAQGEQLPIEFIEALHDPKIEKHAHNATFERNAFKAIGYNIPIEQWHCSAIKAAYCGLPLSLQMVSEALKLEEKGKLSTGKALIRYFCIPCKPTKVNGQRRRNFPHHDPEKWEELKLYCINDVVAEREIGRILKDYKIPEFERQNYILDQKINDRGILIDLKMAANAVSIDEKHSEVLKNQLIELTGLENPNSAAQLKKWLGNAMGKEITSLAKDVMPDLIAEAESDTVKQVLALRKKSSKTSTKKYVAMLNCACDDGRAHGLFQFYGANRTGRWAGRLVQLQNLRRNSLKDLNGARNAFSSGDYGLVTMMYENISDTLSQLIRTSFIAKTGYTFAVADFSAIEARVIAWLAHEQWRLDVFNTHGKIYEASASMMFGLPLEQCQKEEKGGLPGIRDKGKVAELALGYQGSVGALKKMGGEAMGLSEPEMKNIVQKWRKANANIVTFWKNVETYAKAAVKRKRKFVLKKHRNLEFDYDGNVLTIKLPSGRKLFYQSPQITTNRFGQESLKYKGVDQVTKKWWWVDSYGGKFVENIVQAVARDLLADSMLRLNDADFNIVMHVHDEVVCEIEDYNLHEDPMAQEVGNEHMLDRMCEIMGTPIPWAEGLPLNADGYLTPFYKKD